MAVSFSPRTVALALLVMTVVTSPGEGQEDPQATTPAGEEEKQLFSDERAGYHVDTLSNRGIQLLLKWRERMTRTLDEANAKLDAAMLWLNTTTLPNITEHAVQIASPLQDRILSMAADVAAHNLTDQGDGLVAFFKGSEGNINVGGAFDSLNRAHGTFTAPQYGLYVITVRTGQGAGVEISINRNGNETLSTLSHASYFDVKTRIRVMWLNENDEIFTTGSNPTYFGVTLLRQQLLSPDTIME